LEKCMAVAKCFSMHPREKRLAAAKHFWMHFREKFLAATKCFLMHHPQKWLTIAKKFLVYLFEKCLVATKHFSLHLLGKCLTTTMHFSTHLLKKCLAATKHFSAHLLKKCLTIFYASSPEMPNGCQAFFNPSFREMPNGQHAFLNASSHWYHILNWNVLENLWCFYCHFTKIVFLVSFLCTSWNTLDLVHENLDCKNMIYCNYNKNNNEQYENDTQNWHLIVCRDLFTTMIAIGVVKSLHSRWMMHYFIIAYKLVQKPSHKVHD
jgi:hypothetical protein